MKLYLLLPISVYRDFARPRAADSRRSINTRHEPRKLGHGVERATGFARFHPPDLSSLFPYRCGRFRWIARTRSRAAVR